MARFEDLIQAARTGETVDFEGLVTDTSVTEDLRGGHRIEIRHDDLRPMDLRRKAAALLPELLEPAAATPGYQVERDRGLWSWLSAFWISAVAGDDAGSLKFRRNERYVPVDTQRRYYRHLLLGPYLIGRAFTDNLDIAMAVLATPVSKPGELVAQIAGTEKIVANRTLMGAATKLYFDHAEQSIRPGAAGKENPGTVRRLTKLLNQLTLTWDADFMNEDEFIALLPSEFDKFRFPATTR